MCEKWHINVIDNGREFALDYCAAPGNNKPEILKRVLSIFYHLQCVCVCYMTECTVYCCCALCSIVCHTKTFFYSSLMLIECNLNFFSVVARGE